MTSLDTAIIFATKQHSPQADKLGLPYILHPLRVMTAAHAMALRTVMGADHVAIVAVLHDVIEDTNTTEQELADIFGMEVARSVSILSRKRDEYYGHFIGRIVAANNTCLLVKYCDVLDNSSPERLNLLDPATRMRLSKKYHQARVALEVELLKRDLLPPPYVVIS